MSVSRVLRGAHICAACLALLTPLLQGDRPAQAARPASVASEDGWLCVPELERTRWLPPEVTAVLGTQRGRHSCVIDQIVLLSNGTRVGSAGLDGVRFWDAGTLRELDYFRPNLWAGTEGDVAFARDGRRLAVADSFRVTVWTRDPDGWGKIVTMPSEDEFDSFPVDLGGPVSLAFSADGSHLAVGFKSGAIQVFSVSDNGVPLQFVLRWHDERVVALAFREDGKRLGSVARDGRLASWDVVQQKYLGSIEVADARAQIETAVFSRDGAEAAVFLAGAKAIDLYTPTQSGGRRSASVPLAPGVDACCPALAVDAGALAFGYGPHLCWWKQSRGKWQQAGRVEVAGDYLCALSLDAKHGRLAMAGGAGALHVLDVAGPNPKWLASDVRGMQGAMAVAFGPRGRWLAVGGSVPGLVIWSKAGGKVKSRTPKALAREYVHYLRYAPEVGLLASAGPKKLYRLAPPTEDAKLLYQWPEKTSAMDVSPDGKLLARADFARSLDLLQLDSAGARPLASVKTSGAVTVMTFLARGRYLACLASNNTLQLWDTQGGRLRQRWHSFLVNSAHALAVGSDQRVLAAGVCTEIRTWRLREGALVPGHSWECDQGWIASLAFSHDGRWLVSSDGGGNVSVWNAELGTRVKYWQLTGSVRDVSIDPDNAHIATANANGTCYVLRWPNKEAPLRPKKAPP